MLNETSCLLHKVGSPPKPAPEIRVVRSLQTGVLATALLSWSTLACVEGTECMKAPGA